MGSAKKLRSIPSGGEYAVHVERVDGRYRVRCDEPRFEASVAGGKDGGSWSVVTATGSFETLAYRDDGAVHVVVAGERFTFALDAGAVGSHRARQSSERADVKAPMPGKIVKVLVEKGDSVSSGQGVVLFEAMKMQNEIKSPQDGILTEVAVEPGQTVEARDLLFVVRRTN